MNPSTDPFKLLNMSTFSSSLPSFSPPPSLSLPLSSLSLYIFLSLQASVLVAQDKKSINIVIVHLPFCSNQSIDSSDGGGSHHYIEIRAAVEQAHIAKNPDFYYSLAMFLIEDILPLLSLRDFRDKTRIFSDSFTQMFSLSFSNAACGGGNISSDLDLEKCRDESAAFILKMVGIASILIAGIAGIAIPLVGKRRSFLRTDSNLFVAAKAFAAGVILATGFVHMLPDGTAALTDSCLPKYPWSKFPFSGFFAMMAALATLLADFLGTQYYERKQEKQRAGQLARVESEDVVSESGIVVVKEKEGNGKVFGEEEDGGMHIVGIHAHAAHHRHSHPHGHDACEGNLREHVHRSHGHSHGFGDSDEDGGVRHVVVSQVLELGIVSHSIIIGLSLGVSQSPCTIRPLIGALSFHQFFEGFALGGCISEAQFKSLKATIMACFFAITTPSGIALGTGISSFYNPNSPRALIIEGILDSLSAGILVYMSLVDLIAADFMSKRMSCNVRLQVVSYFALFLGAALMALLAVWA